MRINNSGRDFECHSGKRHERSCKMLPIFPDCCSQAASRKTLNLGTKELWEVWDLGILVPEEPDSHDHIDC